MKDLLSFVQYILLGSIECPVCETNFVDNNFGVSKHAVTVTLPDGNKTSHETCGACGDWQGEDLNAIKEGSYLF